ncbi:hypothetical protein BDY21DRAFT_197317 [Lineolata rhizophorae]|uniref:ATPase synthesis protein 25 n=1 Tax=Lineolata rhizophorae TaxID=578093 RepID=A0A6A6P4W3_9PEZI|nr:hypothetical protein BDY21DRAFT_197317 [Lineolata rhizophorae]
MGVTSAVASAIRCGGGRSCIVRPLAPLSRTQFTVSHSLTPTATSISHQVGRRAFSASCAQLSDSHHSVREDEDPLSTASKDVSDPSESTYVPWYLRIEQPSATSAPPPSSADNPMASRQLIPPLPDYHPPILPELLNHISIDLGLDYLSLLDLRKVDPPPALGSNLLMIFGTARSEKHTHVSADRFCRWLRGTHRLKPYADGLLGRNEVKKRLRRQAKRARMMAYARGIAAGEEGQTNDYEDIRSGWVCVNVGRVQSAEGEPEWIQEKISEDFVGFRDEKKGNNIVVQIMTEEKRADLNLEHMWSGMLRRMEREEKERQELEAATAGEYGEAEQSQYVEDPGERGGTKGHGRTSDDPFNSTFDRPHVSNPQTAQQIRHFHYTSSPRSAPSFSWFSSRVRHRPHITLLKRWQHTDSRGGPTTSSPPPFFNSSRNLGTDASVPEFSPFLGQEPFPDILVGDSSLAQIVRDFRANTQNPNASTALKDFISNVINAGDDGLPEIAEFRLPAVPTVQSWSPLVEIACLNLELFKWNFSTSLHQLQNDGVEQTMAYLSLPAKYIVQMEAAGLEVPPEFYLRSITALLTHHGNNLVPESPSLSDDGAAFQASSDIRRTVSELHHASLRHALDLLDLYHARGYQVYSPFLIGHFYYALLGPTPYTIASASTSAASSELLRWLPTRLATLCDFAIIHEPPRSARNPTTPVEKSTESHPPSPHPPISSPFPLPLLSHLLRATASLGLWPSFHATLAISSRLAIPRGPTLYAVTLHAAADSGDMRATKSVLDECLPAMEAEEPAVAIEGDVASGVLRCLEVVRPGVGREVEMGKEAGRWGRVWARAARALKESEMDS